MGYTCSGGADIGECISTARRIKDGDGNSWFDEWMKTANGVYEFGLSSEKEGHTTSAKEAFLRASNYYRTAGFFLHSKKDRDKSMISWRKSKESFLRALKYISDVIPIRIPYEKTTLPGYFVKGKTHHKKPLLLIIHTGFDGTGEELYFEVAHFAAKRGYNCLIFEGPGQGAVIRLQNIPFRYDWEKVVTPVVDYAITRNDVDSNKMALIGISMGGYLAPRAVAFEHRIKACIADGGIFDFSEDRYKSMPPELIELLKTDKAKFNEYIGEVMEKNITARWFFNNGMMVFDVDTPADVMLTIQKYTLKDVGQYIKADMLIIDSEGDYSLKGQAKKLYDNLKSPKDFYLFTKDQSAQAHCQMGAITISNEVIFNWLDKIMK
jgi:alpha-beta hydrolase superfamily lysophospholipase